MNALIQFYKKTIGADTNSVNARELHTFIQSKADYSNWITRRIKKYDFKENQDYIIIQTKKAGNNATLKEYFITLDMAKELSMVENNEKGREARRWFIEMAKRHLQNELCKPHPHIEKLEQTILKQNAIIAEFQTQLTKQSNDEKLKRDNKALQRTLIEFQNRYHSIVKSADNQIEVMRSEIEKMTNCFQMLPNLANDGKNLNTDTKAGHSYW